MNRVVLIMLLAVLSGCAQNFTRVDFKYSNLAHMNYRQAMTSISISPEVLVYDLSEAFRQKGAQVLNREQLEFYPREKEDGYQCWEAEYSIFQKEFEAYRNNSFSAYRSIDRETPFTSRNVSSECSVFENISDESVESWFLRVEFPPRSSQATVYRPTVDDFFIFSQNQIVQGFSTTHVPKQIDIEVATRLYLWAWRFKGSEETSIYLMARPVSGQIEAALGNSIGHKWWQIANGYSEEQTVKNYLFFIEEYDRYKAVQKSNNG